MNTGLRPVASALAAVMAVLVAGCGGEPKNDHAAGPGHGHSHQPKYGGTLVELGEHQGNLEFVRDASAGRLTAYVLDAHAENFVRVPLASFTLVATNAGKAETLVFQPVANTATGEKPGDTSQFEASAGWLKTAPVFDAVLPQITVRGTTFKDVRFNFPKGNE